MRLLSALLFICLGCTLSAQAEAFTPSVLTPQNNPVSLETTPRYGLITLQATLNGTPCTLLFDTGASHTTFDRDFIEKAFPETTFYPLALGGDTNVREHPSAFAIRTLTIGNTELKDFYGVALPLSHLSEQMGLHIDGILGINVMGYTPFILDVERGRVQWLPPSARPIDALAVPMVKESDKLTLRLLGRTSQEGTPFPILIDSGSSYTFFAANQWPPAPDGENVVMRTGDVNETTSTQFTRGADAYLHLGKYTLRLTPYLSETPEAILGVDTLKKLRLYIDAKKRRVLILNVAPRPLPAVQIDPELLNDNDTRR